MFIRSNNVNLLSAPEGIVFGPDGNLYVISYSGLGGVDGVLIFAGPDKPNRRSFLDKIDFADPIHPELRVARVSAAVRPGREGSPLRTHYRSRIRQRSISGCRAPEKYVFTMCAREHTQTQSHTRTEF